jgi:predicted Zn-dependent peptidase
MYETYFLPGGITLRCIRAERFKQSCLSVQLLRPMKKEEAALNALLPAVLLRGSKNYPDLKRITEKLDDLYGASVGTLVRRIGDYQSTGFYCGFIDDRFALDGDAILGPMLSFVGELLLDPLPGKEGFDADFVESEKKNLISVIDSERADKRAYAASQLLKRMGKADSFGIPRLGEKDDVAAITPKAAFDHYKTILRQSPIELFYVGSAPGEKIRDFAQNMFASLERAPQILPPQTAFCPSEMREDSEVMEIAQGKLAMGFLTPITHNDPRFAAMQVANTIFGSGQTSKLFMQIRESQSLCYAIGSSYFGSKGVITVNAGIDFDKETAVKQEVLRQLQLCKDGAVTEEELISAKQTLLSGLRSVYDSPGAMEGYFSTAAITGQNRTPEEHIRQVEAVTLADVAEASSTISYHSTFFLKGGAQ